MTTYDALLALLVTACTEYIETLCGGRRIVDTAEVTEYHDGGDGSIKNLQLRRWPVNSFTGVYYNDSSDYSTPSWTAFNATSDYIRKDASGQLYFPGGLPSGIQNIKVTYRGGYVTASVPEGLAQACKMLVGKVFNKRKADGILTEGVGGGSISWDRELDPTVKMLIDPYRDLSI